MKRPVSSDLKALKWSEPIVVLGRGIPNYSHKYRRTVYCIAAVDDTNKWLRLYPVTFKGKNEMITPFDKIIAPIRDGNPEKIRPESQKIFLYPEIKKSGHISNNVERTSILKKMVDSGEFLHDKSWDGIKTLGLIQPIHPEFEIMENVIIVKYKCNAPNCKGHKNEIPLHTMTEYQIEESIYTCPEILEKELLLLKREVLLQRQQLWFVMGTHSQHPDKWMLIEIHITNKS